MSYLVFFSPFSIAITLLGEERANLSAFRTFVRFALVWFCLFLLLFFARIDTLIVIHKNKINLRYVQFVSGFVAFTYQ